MHVTSQSPNGPETYIAKKRVYYTGSDALKQGYALCYDRDSTTSTFGGATEAAASFGPSRYQKVEKPSITNIMDFAGFVAQDYSAAQIAKCPWIDIVIPQIGSEVLVNAQVSCTCKTTVLGVIPGSYTLRAGVVFPEVGKAFLALQTVDRSSTAGTVQASCIPAEGILARKATTYFFDDFLSAIGPYAKDLALADESDPVGEISVVADRGRWLATLVDGDSDAGETMVIDDDAVTGVLTLTTNDKDNDNINLAMNGSMFKMAVGTPLYFEARVAQGDVDTQEFFVGLTDSATTAYTTPGDDHVGFRNDGDGALDFTSDESGSGPTADTALATLENGAYVKVAFLWDGIDTLSYYVDDVLQDSIDLTDDDICDDVVLTPTICVQAADASTASLKIDYLDIRNALASPRQAA